MTRRRAFEPLRLPGTARRPRRARPLRDELKAEGVQTTWYPALHTFSECRELAPAGGLPRAEQAAERHCALPLSSTMDQESVAIVVAAVRGALNTGG